MSESDPPVVLIVEDEPDVAETYKLWLQGDYEVRMAQNGDAGLEMLDETVDVVLLDRMMPGLSGDEVLTRIEERGLDCRVVMVTAIDPDFDIIEMPFDEYLTKPVDGSTLLEMVESMLRRESYDEQLQEYFSMASKKATLESEKNPVELESHDEYSEVSQRVEQLREQADNTVSEMDDFESAFRDFPSG